MCFTATLYRLSRSMSGKCDHILFRVKFHGRTLGFFLYLFADSIPVVLSDPENSLQFRNVRTVYSYSTLVLSAYTKRRDLGGIRASRILNTPNTRLRYPPVCSVRTVTGAVTVLRSQYDLLTPHHTHTHRSFSNTGQLLPLNVKKTKYTFPRFEVSRRVHDSTPSPSRPWLNGISSDVYTARFISRFYSGRVSLQTV